MSCGGGSGMGGGALCFSITSLVHSLVLSLYLYFYLHESITVAVHFSPAVFICFNVSSWTFSLDQRSLASLSFSLSLPPSLYLSPLRSETAS